MQEKGKIEVWKGIFNELLFRILSLKISNYLASFFLKNGILERKKKQNKSYSTLLELEINSILNNNVSYTLKILNKYFLQILKNRSNAHFRW